MSARERLLKFLQQEAEKPLTAEELFARFNISRDERKIFVDLLAELEKEGLIYQNNAGKYGIPDKFHLIRGRIERNPKGFGFLIPEDPAREDVYISPENMKGAMHNDRVFVRVLNSGRGNREEGEVIRILERANRQIVGNLEKDPDSYFAFVVPDNKRIYNDVFIPESELNGARDRQKVVARITRWPEQNRNPEGKVIEILGFKDESGVDIEAIIRQLELPRQFPSEVKAEADAISGQIGEKEIEERLDLRDLPLVTIDGEDAKDFDDAVSIELLGEEKVRLGVHIADVSHYVEEDSPLDEEARERATSIYLVDRVIPMLPEKLSNDLCSLRPGEDRLSFSVFIDYQLQPLKLLDYEIVPSIINSNYRLTYTEVNKMLAGSEPELQEKYSDFYDRLQLMDRLRDKLRSERFGNGSIDFDFPEVKVILNEQGKPIELKKRRHDRAEQLIEEFMIVANRVVAEDMYWREIPFIYRVHDSPDSDRMHEFNEFIHNFGYHLKGLKNGVHPRELQELMEKIKGTDVERIISTVLLRTMKKAIYSGNNIGHFGLALNYYTHFTSPIRRYPDLMIHRIMKKVIERGSLSNKYKQKLSKDIPAIAEHSSFRERKAMEAERDSVDLKKVEFMKDKIGFEYEGIISGMTGFGFFVELDNTVEGLVHVESLDDDYYYYYPELQAMVGERTGNQYRLGDRVKIKVAKVNVEERQLDLVLVEK